MSHETQTPHSSLETTRQSKRATTEALLAQQALLDGFIPIENSASPHDTLKEDLERQIIGQPAAIAAIIDSIHRAEVRLSSDQRPIATMAFLGPTGVGKSETAKLLAEQLAEDEANIIKIDCSSLSEGHEVATLTGAPPGYTGHDQEPLLAKERVEQPGTVLLFDEIEKGSQKLFKLMLQIMGDGQLQLNNGDTVSFRDTIIILTSNLGAKETSDRITKQSIGFAASHEPIARAHDLDAIAADKFKTSFAPEFINRLDKIVVFKPLGRDNISKILTTKITTANDEYEEEYGVRLTLSQTAHDAIVDAAMNDSAMGARSLLRTLETHIQSTFGRHMASGAITDGTHVHVFHKTELPPNTSHASDFLFTHKPDETLVKPKQADLSAFTPKPASHGKELMPTFLPAPRD